MPRNRQPSPPSEAFMKTLLVGGKVNIYRRALGLSIGGFARRCRVSEKTMEPICLQQRDPSAKTLWHIIHYGGMSPDAFDAEDFGQEGLA